MKSFLFLIILCFGSVDNMSWDWIRSLYLFGCYSDVGQMDYMLDPESDNLREILIEKHWVSNVSFNSW